MLKNSEVNNIFKSNVFWIIIINSILEFERIDRISRFKTLRLKVLAEFCGYFTFNCGRLVLWMSTAHS